MIEINWTAQGILALISLLLAIVFEYFPMVKDWYDKLGSNGKGPFMFCAIAFIVWGSFALSFAPWFKAFTPDIQGFWNALIMFGLCLAGNQGVHQTTKRNV